MTHPDKEMIEASGRFDGDFYRRTYREAIPAGQLPLDHFLTGGQAQGFLASPHFDPIVYKLKHPLRQSSNPLADSIRRGDRDDCRDIAALFRRIDVREIPTAIGYSTGLESQWTEHSRAIVENLDRSTRLPWTGREYELRNPAPSIVLSRLAENRPFAFARLTHGLWDSLYILHRLADRIERDPLGSSLTDRERKNAAVRLFAYAYLDQGKDLEVENFAAEIEQDMLHNPKDPDFWTAIALRGLPTFDDGTYGFNKDGVKARLDLIARFIDPGDTLFDATLWKRWALSGDLARIAEAARNHPVVLIGPDKFHTLGATWRLPKYRHVVIGTRLSQLIRHDILEEAFDSLRAAAASSGPKPIVLFQCGALAYWLIRRLRVHHPDAFYLDLGQALDLWYWSSKAPWMGIYSEAIQSANPFAVQTATLEGPTPAAVAATARIDAILRRDYLDTGLMALPPARPVCDLKGNFHKQGARGWTIALSDELMLLSDDDKSPRKSPLVLLENGKPLGVGHDVHEAILNEGSGRYSFWQDTLYFSTSDGSDPAKNGRSYAIGRIDMTDKEADQDVAPVTCLLELASEFQPDGPRGWFTQLPNDLEALTDDPKTPRGSPLLLLEDGRALGSGHALHEAIRAGGGSYSFWRGGLYFSTPDNSDPNVNGRTYSVARPAPLREAIVSPELAALFGATDRGFVGQFRSLLAQGPGWGGGRGSPFDDLSRKFVIGFTARVGSTLLCQHLSRYGVAVGEFLNQTHIRAEAHVRGAKDYNTLLSRLIETYAVDGVWGVKAHIDSLIPLFFVGEFPARLGDWRFVYLTRDNIVRQAISRIIAAKTLSWTSWQPQARQIAVDDYSRDEIRRSIDDIRDTQQLWEAFFTLFRIQPLRLTYEEINADPVAAADRVAAYCGLTLGGEQRVREFQSPPLQIQSTSVNAAWEARFRNNCEP